MLPINGCNSKYFESRILYLYRMLYGRRIVSRLTGLSPCTMALIPTCQRILALCRTVVTVTLGVLHGLPPLYLPPHRLCAVPKAHNSYDATKYTILQEIQIESTGRTPAVADGGDGFQGSHSASALLTDHPPLASANPPAAVAERSVFCFSSSASVSTGAVVPVRVYWDADTVPFLCSVYCTALSKLGGFMVRSSNVHFYPRASATATT